MKKTLMSFGKNRNYFIPSIVFSLGLLTACGQSPNSNGSADSEQKVTNGKVISDEVYPSAVLLILASSTGEGLCTGTFVNDSQVVTAGHCVDGNPTIYYAKTVNGVPTPVAKAVDYKAHPAYSIELGVNPHDVAVITFAQDTAPATTPIAESAPGIGTNFTIVGFGNNANFNNDAGILDGSGAGVKRHGSNSIGAIDNAMFAFGGLTGKEPASIAAKGTMVASGEGDSGGPMFVGQKLVGVTSGGGLTKAEDGVTDVAISFYVDLNESSNRRFLESQIVGL